MDDDNRLNGHKPTKLLPVLFAAMVSAGPVQAADTPFDLDAALAAVVRLRAEIPPDARTAPYLGTEREGSGIVIGADGLILTIGYLILEAMAVSVADADGRMMPAEIVAYDYDTGFGLVRALRPLGIQPLELGSSAGANERDPVLIASAGGQSQTIGGFVVDRREFAGYWEYMLEDAIFTSPPHPNFGGAALIGMDGTLLGVGSLYVEDALTGDEPLPGNMFIPIDLLKPILGELLLDGRPRTPPRPWLGLFSTETLGRILVAQVATDGPAERAGLKSGDVIVKVDGAHVSTMSELYRRIWRLGRAGVDVPLTILRGSHAFDVVVRSGNRYDYLKLRQTY